MQLELDKKRMEYQGQNEVYNIELQIKKTTWNKQVERG